MITPLKRPLPFAAAAGLVPLVALTIIGGGGADAAGASPPPAVAHIATGPLSASTALLSFGSGTVGDIFGPQDVTFTNTSATPDTVTDFTFAGTDPDDFIEIDQCGTLAAGASCVVQVYFVPGTLGFRQATISPNDGSASPPVITLDGTGTEGYYETTAQGGLYTHGDAAGFGGETGTALSQPIVGSAATGDDAGYWLVASDGGIFTFGDAGYFGSTGGIHLNKPIVGMAATLDAGGYWLVASDGGIFTFGDAEYYGSTGGIILNKPIVGMAATPDGGGYWLVASDGGIFTFGDAQFYGSTGGIHLNKPIVGMAATPDGGGYWLMAADGGIFTFGDAPFDGSSTGASTANFVSIAGDGPPTLQAFLGVPAIHRAAALEDAHLRLR
ncbi:MAG: choice-of-anchor D domain-containing protein [Acidimicrobiales bacterium]